MPRSNRVTALALAATISGCAFSLDGPKPDRRRYVEPACDTSKSLVTLDGVMATVAGVIGLSTIKDSGGAGAIGILTGATYLVSALYGNSKVNACREELAVYNHEVQDRAEEQRASRPRVEVAPLPQSTDRVAACHRIDLAYQACHVEVELATAAPDAAKIEAARQQAELEAKQQREAEAAEQAARREPTEPDLSPPASEVVAAAAVDLPVVPSFPIPAVESGFHHPAELRANGAAIFDTTVAVKGYIVGVYDCVVANAKSGEPRESVQHRIDTNPALCERPKFFLDSTSTGQIDRALWVVDVPGPPTNAEREHLTPAALAAWPKVPSLTLGDYVVVRGAYKRASPLGERDPDGLVVFSSIEKAKPGRAVASAPVAPPIDPEVAVASVPRRAYIAPERRASSLDFATRAAVAMRNRQYDVAVDLYTRSTTAWPGNHLAWFGLGESHGARADWGKAAAAYQRAANLRPDAAMYLLRLGISLASTSTPDDRVAARENLVRATMLEPELWRAHLYLGHVERERGRRTAAATAFTAAIHANPRELEPYLALADLYLHTDHFTETIAVAERGLTSVPTAPAALRAELAYTSGMALVSAGRDDRALAAFTFTLATQPGHARAKLARARLAVRSGNVNAARRDLEDLAKLEGGGLVRQEAMAMLAAL